MAEIHLELPDDLAGALAGLARDRGMTVECLVEEVLRNYLGQGADVITGDQHRAANVCVGRSDAAFIGEIVSACHETVKGEDDLHRRMALIDELYSQADSEDHLAACLAEMVADRVHEYELKAVIIPPQSSQQGEEGGAISRVSIKRPRLRAVLPLPGARLRLTFVNGQCFDLKMSHMIGQSLGLKPLSREGAFEGATLGDGGWTVEWPKLDIQIGADTLLLDALVQATR